MKTSTIIEIRDSNLPEHDRAVVVAALKNAYAGILSEKDFKNVLTEPLLRFGAPPDAAKGLWGDIFYKLKSSKRKAELAIFISELHCALKNHEVNLVSFDIVPGPGIPGYQCVVTVA